MAQIKQFKPSSSDGRVSKKNEKLLTLLKMQGCLKSNFVMMLDIDLHFFNLTNEKQAHIK